VICYQHLSMCSLGSVPLLERWCTLEWAAHPLERWRPPTLHVLHTCRYLGLWESWQPIPHHLAPLSSHLVRAPSTLGAPSFIGNLPLVLYIEAIIPLQASWSLRRIACCIIDIVILFSYWNKRRLWRSNWWIVQVCGCICV
jgi:hypothetical protein